ncbi:response regulator [Polaribacter litorisediminis]|uniref:response regulator n=1 Tax=Polaribacter litorisediminis TaxID=1908341 RepID=UPI001CBA9C5A|nr:response regulator [Polaribacter litorisediminis]UAM98572.1 response regulator [Polaribacter litorisediminis]
MSKKILLVYNDQGVSFLLKKMLKSPNIDITIKRTYEEVAYAISKNRYNLILTDAVINGNFFFQYIEDLRFNAPKTRIVVMSQMSQSSMTASLEKMGVKDFISLPAPIPAIKELISKYIL